MYWWYAVFGGTPQINCQLNCQKLFFTATVPRSSKTASRFKGDVEQWIGWSPPFGTSLSPFLKQYKKGIAPISAYTYAKPIIPAFRA